MKAPVPKIGIKKQKAMKTRIFSFFAIVLAGAAACQRPSVPQPSAQTVTYHAALGDETKSQLGGDGSVLWTPGDAIHIFFTTESSARFATGIKSPSSPADFTGDASGLEKMASGASVWAVYPYSEEQRYDGNSVTLTVPAEQVAAAGTFGQGLFPSMARSNGFQLMFYNLCGGVKFSVARSGVKTVRFRGNGGENLAGTVKVAFDTSGKPKVNAVVSGASEIVVTAPGGGTFTPGTWYYIVTLPATLSKGYTLDFDGDAKVSDKSVTIKRAIWGVLDGADGMKVDTQSLSFPAQGGSKTIGIKAAGAWSVQSSAAWCHVSPASGNGNGTVTVTIDENLAESRRGATLTITQTATSIRSQVSVSQSGVGFWSQEFHHKSLIMDFTATWCQYCPRMARAIEYYDEHYPGKLEAVCVHGGASDYVFADYSTLMNQYGVNGYPTAIVDGRRSMGASSNASYTGGVIKQYTDETEANYSVSSAIGMSSSWSGETLSADVTLYVKEAASYKVTVLLLEDGRVSYQEDADYGGQSNYHHNDILRMSLSAVKGDSFVTSTPEQTVSRHYEATVPSDYVKENLRLLVYVQRAYGTLPVLSDGNYGGYFIDNAASGAVGTTVEPAVD